MLDEIQTGMARSGKMFACQHEAVLPDVMTLAKALGNGVPIGACLTRGNAADVIKPGNHGSTFGGNPLACRAGYTVLKSMIETDTAENAALRGEQLAEALRKGLGANPRVAEIRHLGLLLAIQMNIPCQELVARALEQGLLINVTAESVVRLLPPLIINEAETAEIADKLITCINQFTE
jgi:acetylornithine aminotransferase